MQWKYTKRFLFVFDVQLMKEWEAKHSVQSKYYELEAMTFQFSIRDYQLLNQSLHKGSFNRISYVVLQNFRQSSVLSLCVLTLSETPDSKNQKKRKKIVSLILKARQYFRIYNAAHSTTCIFWYIVGICHKSFQKKHFFPSNDKEILKLGENLSYTQTNTEIWKEATISWQTIQVYSSKKKKFSKMRR